MKSSILSRAFGVIGLAVSVIFASGGSAFASAMDHLCVYAVITAAEGDDYAASAKLFDAQLAHHASLSAGVGFGAGSSLMRESHGFRQASADEVEPTHSQVAG